MRQLDVHRRQTLRNSTGLTSLKYWQWRWSTRRLAKSDAWAPLESLLPILDDWKTDRAWLPSRSRSTPLMATARFTRAGTQTPCC
jgi:hypothetical protein